MSMFMELTMYDEPQRKELISLSAPTPDGIIYIVTRTEESDKIMVHGTMAYDKDATDEDCLACLELNQITIEEVEFFCVEPTSPVYFFEKPYICSEYQFFVKNTNVVETDIFKMENIFHVSDEDIILVYRVDLPHEYVEYYGYLLKDQLTAEITTRFRKYSLHSAKEYFAACAKRDLKYSGSEEQKRSDANYPKTMDDPLTAKLREQRKRPKIIPDILAWLDRTDYQEFYSEIATRVCGQSELMLLVANVYNYLSCVANGRPHNSNMLLAAPSGCGKTETFRALRDYFAREIPKLLVVQKDMTSITEEGFKGANTKELIIDMLDNEYSGGIGLIFLDEFDKKLLPSYSSGGNNVNMAVQSQILTMVEGRIFEAREIKIDTSLTMYVGMGSFDACRQTKSVETHFAGFGAENSSNDHYEIISREDMIELGGSYELIGRFATVINYQKLTDDTILEIAEGMAEKIGESFGCKVVLSEVMKEKLLESANSKYGCRILDSMIRQEVLRAYAEAMQRASYSSNRTIIVGDVGDCYWEA